MGLKNSQLNGIPPTGPGVLTVNTPNGFGGTAIAVRRWSNIVKQSGIGIQYYDDVNLGGRFFVRKPGMYSITYSDSSALGTGVGILKNMLPADYSAGLTTLTGLSTIITIGNSGTNDLGGCSVTAWFESSDCIVPITSNTTDGTYASYALFSIVGPF